MPEMAFANRRKTMANLAASRGITKPAPAPAADRHPGARATGAEWSGGTAYAAQIGPQSRTGGARLVLLRASLAGSWYSLRFPFFFPDGDT